jgi:hypothetical protein
VTDWHALRMREGHAPRPSRSCRVLRVWFDRRRELPRCAVRGGGYVRVLGRVVSVLPPPSGRGVRGRVSCGRFAVAVRVSRSYVRCVSAPFGGGSVSASVLVLWCDRSCCSVLAVCVAGEGGHLGRQPLVPRFLRSRRPRRAHPRDIVAERLRAAFTSPVMSAIVYHYELGRQGVRSHTVGSMRVSYEQLSHLLRCPRSCTTVRSATRASACLTGEPGG